FHSLPPSLPPPPPLLPSSTLFRSTKYLSPKRIRVLLSDGKTLSSNSMFVSDQIDNLYRQNKLEKFTVIRLEQYLVDSLPTNSNRSEEHTSELQSRFDIVRRPLVAK